MRIFLKTIENIRKTKEHQLSFAGRWQQETTGNSSPELSRRLLSFPERSRALQGSPGLPRAPQSSPGLHRRLQSFPALHKWWKLRR